MGTFYKVVLIPVNDQGVVELPKGAIPLVIVQMPAQSNMTLPGKPKMHVQCLVPL